MEQPIAWVENGNARGIYVPQTPQQVMEIPFTTPAAQGGKHAFTGGAYPPGHPTHRKWELVGPDGVAFASIQSQSPSFIVTVGASSSGFGWIIHGLKPSTTYILRATTIDSHGNKIDTMLPADFYVDLNNSPH